MCPKDGRPKHISEPESSLFYVTTEAAYNQLSAEAQSKIWLDQGKLAIVQTSCKDSEKAAFTRSGLESLTGRLDADIQVQGSYFPLSVRNDADS
jgi:hypothetical protein